MVAIEIKNKRWYNLLIIGPPCSGVSFRPIHHPEIGENECKNQEETEIIVGEYLSETLQRVR